MDIFVGKDAGGTDIFRVQYRRRNAQGGSYQVRGVVLTAGGEETTGWVDINDTSANAGLDTSAYLLDAVHLGPSNGLSAVSSQYSGAARILIDF